MIKYLNKMSGRTIYVGYWENGRGYEEGVKLIAYFAIIWYYLRIVELFIPPSQQNRPEAFTDQFRSFYDPRRDYYRAQTAELLGWLCEGRCISPDPDVRRHVGSRIITREMAQTRLITTGRHDNAGGLGIVLIQDLCNIKSRRPKL